MNRSIKKTLVIGGSVNPVRFSNRAIRQLLAYNLPVVAAGLRAGDVEGVKIQTDFPAFENIHTVTLYVGPKNQPHYYDYIISIKPKRIIFNPGTENDEFMDIAAKNNIEVVQNCTLIMIMEGSY